MKRTVTIVLVALTACTGLAACGGSDDKSSGGSKAADNKLSRSELAAKADAICKVGEDAAKNVKTPDNFEDATVAAEYFGKVVPLHQKQTDDLAALMPDDEAKADWDAFMAKQNEDNTILIGILAKAKAKDPSGLKDVQKLQTASVAFAAAAKKIGSTGCAGTA